MALNPGARLGPYQIVATVGAGGMGEVYRARDTRIAAGQRFLVRVPVHDVTSAPIHMLTNWMTRAAAE